MSEEDSDDLAKSHRVVLKDEAEEAESVEGVQEILLAVLWRVDLQHEKSPSTPLDELFLIR